MTMKNMVCLLSAVFLMCGCTTVNTVINEYYTIQDEIKVGDSRKEVLSWLEANQSSLRGFEEKAPVRYTKDGSVYDIYYARTANILDYQITDDEFTPYIFKDGILIEIGWEYLGGAKRTSAEVAREQAEIQKARAGATKVNIKNEQKVYQEQ